MIKIVNTVAAALAGAKKGQVVRRKLDAHLTNTLHHYQVGSQSERTVRESGDCS
jgi:hypothetical protein